MAKHISSKCTAATVNIKSISSIWRFINLDTAKWLATSLVLTHMGYSNSTLCSRPRKSIIRLQDSKAGLQKLCFIVTNSPVKLMLWSPFTGCQSRKGLIIKSFAWFTSVLTIWHLHTWPHDWLSSTSQETPGPAIEVSLSRFLSSGELLMQQGHSVSTDQSSGTRYQQAFRSQLHLTCLNIGWKPNYSIGRLAIAQTPHQPINKAT
jgi:hypothetical protein